MGGVLVIGRSSVLVLVEATDCASSTTATTQVVSTMLFHCGVVNECYTRMLSGWVVSAHFARNVSHF